MPSGRRPCLSSATTLALAWSLIANAITTQSFATTTPTFVHQSHISSTPLFTLKDTTSTTTAETTGNALGKPGTAKLDKPWTALGFEFRPTKSHLRIVWKDGEWGEMELVKSPYIELHIGATALHYGQACLEGLKAFCHPDNSVAVFRPEENAKRIKASCERLMMPVLPSDLFLDAVNEVVRDNVEYVPPYGSGGALYLRPILFGSGPRIGLAPSDEYTFLIMAVPVGDYYKGGLGAPVDAIVVEDYDRAAPRGVGNVKVAGNYAADLLPNMLSKKKGYPISLYLDAKSRSLVEEFSTSNFVGIDNKNKVYATPVSRSILQSITNKSLMEIARVEEGFEVEEREIRLEELSRFDEVVACGTAVVVTPVGSVTKLGDVEGEMTKYEFGHDGEIGPTTRRLYDRVRAIQCGEVDDVYGWNVKIN